MTAPPAKLLQTAEGRRLLDMNAGAPWRHWGPYLSERKTSFYRTSFRVECPVGSGVERDLREVADELSRRLTRLFLPDARGERPSTKDAATVAGAPLFREYFHGDTGRGLGASHQTGWTGLIANIIEAQQTSRSS